MLVRSSGMSRPPADQARYQRAVETVPALCGDERYERQFREGEALTRAQAVQQAEALLDGLPDD